MSQELFAKLYSQSLAKHGLKVIDTKTFTNAEGVLISVVKVHDGRGYDIWSIFHLTNDGMLIAAVSVMTFPDSADPNSDILGADQLHKMEKQFSANMNVDSYEDLVQFMADHFTLEE